MKQGVLVLWFALLAGSVFATGWLGTTSTVVFWLIAAVHLAEFFAKRTVLQRAGGSLVNPFVQVLIYGLFHWKPLEEQQTAGSTDRD